MNKLSEKQILKGKRHLKNAQESVYRYMKEIVDFKKFCNGKNFICGTDITTLELMKSNLIEARERLSRLQRKYI